MWLIIGTGDNNFRNLSTQDIEQYITYPVEIEMANLPGVQEIRSISQNSDQW
jgi:Cu/Ag efflux pump CusA